MKKTGIMTDSHSGILENEASKLGIAVLPMPFYIDEKLYLELERLSKEVYEASISKLINVAIEDLIEKEKIEVYENKNRTCVTRSILIRESLLKGLSELKIKYGLSISMLVNIAVKNEIMEEQK